MDFDYCRRCSGKLTQQAGHVYTCENEHTLYLNCSPTVGIFFVTDKDEIMLSKRGIEPRIGMLDSFGGFLDGEESFESAAARELKEELGLEIGDYTKLEYLCSAVGHYPYKKEVLPIISVFYWSRITSHRPLVPADDVADIVTIPIANVNLELLHDDDIRTGFKTLQHLIQTNKVKE